MVDSQPLAARPAVPRRVRVLQWVSWIGLGLSTATLIAALPNMFAHGGGADTVLTNAAAGFWALLVIGVAVAPVRTIGVRALAGAWFSGFFGITALAGLVGRPAVDAFGADSAIAAAVVAPLTEEPLKVLPVAVFLILASRNRRSRPSAGDAALFAATVGAGFAVYENAQYARGVAGPLSHLPISALLPTMQETSDTAGSMLVGGHLVYTALVGLGLGITVAYRRRIRLAWLAAPVAFAVVVIEHMTANQVSILAADAPRPGWVDATLALTLGGYLSTVLLIAGVAGTVIAERRMLRRVSAGSAGGATLLRYLWPSGPQIAARGSALALVQVAPAAHQLPAAAAPHAEPPPPPPPPPVAAGGGQAEPQETRA